MSEKPQPRRSSRVKKGLTVVTGLAALHGVPGPVGTPGRGIVGGAEATGSVVEGGAQLAAELLNLKLPTSAQAETSPSTTPTAQPRSPEYKANPVHRIERPAMDSPWLEHLSQRQAEIIQDFEHLDAEQKQFLTMAIFEVRRLIAEGHKINPGTTIAQAALETGWGKDAPGFNYFGIKVGTSTSGWEGESQLYPNAAELNSKTHKLQTKPGVFRKYDSARASFEDYAHLIEEHYHQAAENWENVDEYINGLGAYATGENYQGRLKEMVHESHLEFLAEIPSEEFTP